MCASKRVVFAALVLLVRVRSLCVLSVVLCRECVLSGAGVCVSSCLCVGVVSACLFLSVYGSFARNVCYLANFFPRDRGCLFSSVFSY